MRLRVRLGLTIDHVAGLIAAADRERRIAIAALIATRFQQVQQTRSQLEILRQSHATVFL